MSALKLGVWKEVSWVEVPRADGTYAPRSSDGISSSTPMRHDVPQDMIFTLTAPMPTPIRRVLDASTLEGRSTVAWLLDPATDIVRKACLLNMLAALSVTPTIELALIHDVLHVFKVKSERIYAVVQTGVRQTLEAYVADPRMPFYEDSLPVNAVHHALLDEVPELQRARLRSFRAEGAPSLQIVIADNDTMPTTVADIDLDAHNPLEDVAGFISHAFEQGITDQFAMRAMLSRGPAARCLCYTLA